MNERGGGRPPEILEEMAQQKENETHPRETEIPYAVRWTDLEKDIDFSTLQKIEIVQHYFPEDEVMLRAIMALIPNLDVPKNVAGLTNARIRQSQAGEETSYWFTIKNPKDANHTRAEIETEISPRLYQELMIKAFAGSLEKTRYLVPGTAGEEALPIKAEIDQLTNVRGEAVDLPFGIVGVECSSEEARQAFLAGNHTLPFVKKGLEITDVKELRTRSLAEKGYTEKVKNRVKSLNQSLKLYNLS